MSCYNFCYTYLMKFLQILLSWILLWFTGWAVWLMLIKRGINHVVTFRISSLYFFSLFLVTVFYYNYRLKTFITNLPIKVFPFFFLFFFFIILTCLYYYSNRIFNKEILMSHKEKYMYFATMDYRYLISKSFDILFQQIALLCLILSLRELISSSFQIILLVGVIFGLIHIPLLKTKYNKIAPYFIIASFFAGVVFSFLILLLPYGLIYSYAIHWCFYAIAGLLINIRSSRRQKYMISVNQNS